MSLDFLRDTSSDTSVHPRRNGKKKKCVVIPHNPSVPEEILQWLFQGKCQIHFSSEEYNFQSFSMYFLCSCWGDIRKTSARTTKRGWRARMTQTGGTRERGVMRKRGGTQERGATRERGGKQERGATQERGGTWERGGTRKRGGMQERGATWEREEERKREEQRKREEERKRVEQRKREE